jgi:hypothetical protein
MWRKQPVTSEDNPKYLYIRVKVSLWEYYLLWRFATCWNFKDDDFQFFVPDQSHRLGGRIATANLKGILGVFNRSAGVENAVLRPVHQGQCSLATSLQLPPMHSHST